MIRSVLALSLILSAVGCKAQTALLDAYENEQAIREEIAEMESQPLAVLEQPQIDAVKRSIALLYSHDTEAPYVDRVTDLGRVFAVLIKLHEEIEVRLEFAEQIGRREI